MNTRLVGAYRGLGFGLVLYPNGAAEVFLEGAVIRHGLLSRDHRGPRAVMNAVERLAGTYQGQCDATGHDLAIARAQLRDHEPASAARSPTTLTWPN